MRTPGHDIELALGLLSAEHVIGSLADVTGVRISAEAGEQEDRVEVADDIVESNQIDIRVREGSGRRPERSFLATSACGVCGATTVGHWRTITRRSRGRASRPRCCRRWRSSCAAVTRFDATGGLHAAGLFTAEGSSSPARGHRPAQRRRQGGRSRVSTDACALELRSRRERARGVRGRAEGVAAGIPILVAVGAPSSLASRPRCASVSRSSDLRDDRFKCTRTESSRRSSSPVA